MEEEELSMKASQALYWVRNIRASLSVYDKASDGDKIESLRPVHDSILVLVMALNGVIDFVGVPQDGLGI